MLFHYGGGGHHQVGTCQVDAADADRVIGEILEKIK
jgi:nanoRNase/pAp phosphatase (c-di-AMP/oligoRNAs hydrolase)